MAVDWTILMNGGVAVGTLALAGVTAYGLWQNQKNARRQHQLDIQRILYGPLLKETEGYAVWNRPRDFRGSRVWREVRHEHRHLEFLLKSRMRKRILALEAHAEALNVERSELEKKFQQTARHNLTKAGVLTDSKPFHFRLGTSSSSGPINLVDFVASKYSLNEYLAPGGHSRLSPSGLSLHISDGSSRGTTIDSDEAAEAFANCWEEFDRVHGDAIERARSRCIKIRAELSKLQRSLESEIRRWS